MPHGEYLLWEWSLKELSVAFNHLGEFPYRDPEYRRMKASEIYKKLRGTI
jgi:hypothetical protein